MTYSSDYAWNRQTYRYAPLPGLGVLKIIGLLHSSFYFAIGKPTPWGVPDEPPSPPGNLGILPEVLFYKKARRVLPALLSPCGNLPVVSRPGAAPELWYVVEDWEDRLYADGGVFPVAPTHLYVELELEPEDLQVPSYRAVALYANLRFNRDSSPGSIAVPPSLVEDVGAACWVAYHLPVARLTGRTHTVQVLLRA